MFRIALFVYTSIMMHMVKRVEDLLQTYAHTRIYISTVRWIFGWERGWVAYNNLQMLNEERGKHIEQIVRGQ